MSVIEKDIKKYLSDVGENLICSKEQKDAILSDIEASVTEFAEQNGCDNIEAIYKHFGTPQDIANAQLSNLDPVTVKKALSKKKAVIVALIIALVIFAAGVIAIVVENNKECGYIVEGPANEIILDDSTTD